MPSWSIPPPISGRCRSRWLLPDRGLALYARLACALALYFWQDGPARLLVFAHLLCRGRMAARPSLHRLSLESAGLWLGRVAGGAAKRVGLMGAYGLSFLTILLGASLAEFCHRRWRAPAGDGCCCSPLLWAYGAVRLADTPTRRCAGCTVAAGAARYSAARKIRAPL